MRCSRLVALAVGLVTCACLPNGISAGTLTPLRSQAAAGATRYGTVAFSIKVPRLPAAKPALGPRGIRPLYVSVSTKSFAVLTDGKNAVVANVNPATGYAYIYIHATVGTHTFTVKAYDQLGAQGKLLSTGTTAPLKVPATGYARVYLTLDGVVASVALTLAQTVATVGSPAIINLNVLAFDADGNTIVAGNFTQPLTLTSSDPVDGTISQTTLLGAVNEQPAFFERVSVHYNGANVGRITFSASSAGLKAATPAVLTLLPQPTAGEKIIVTGGYDPNAVFSTENGFQFLGSIGQSLQQESLGYDLAAVDTEAGILYVLNYQTTTGNLYEAFQTSGSYAMVDSFNLPISTPDNLAIDSIAKRLFTSDVDDTNVSIFSLTSGHAKLGTIPTGFYNSALALDSSAQRLYVAGCLPACGIAVFNSAPPFNELLSEATLTGPFSIAVDSGKIYVEEWVSSPATPNAPSPYVDVYDASRLNMIARYGPFPNPTGPIAIDGTGRRLYVLLPQSVSPYNSIVQAYGLDTGLSYLGSFTTTSAASHIAIAPGRTPFSANARHRVQR